MLFRSHTRTYEDFRKQLTPQIKPVFEDIRSFCLSLGNNVLEDVRMHRIVFCKSLTFRYFADIEPQRESVITKIRRDRKEPIREVEIKPGQSLVELKDLLSDAYSNIH